MLQIHSRQLTSSCISSALAATWAKSTTKVEEVEKDEGKKKEKKNINNKSLVELKIGDNVRLYESKSIGTIDSIKKNKAIVNYGKFTTQVDLEKLEYVK